MAFFETPRFPDDLACWLSGGRGFNTMVVDTFGGDEYRDGAWAMARGVWDVSEALRTIPDGGTYSIKPLVKMLLVARGRLHGFRVKAPYDNSDDSSGVLGLTGVGVASTLAYQMYKNYTISPIPVYQQIVQKPVATGLKIYKNGVLQTLTTHYTINAATGIVTFVSQPTIGQTLTWTGNYDVPVRFGGDLPDVGRISGGALAGWHGLKLVEIRNPDA